MSHILVGQFDTFDAAQAAVSELRSLGLAQSDMEVFMLNPPGAHARYPVGGDQDEDREARKGDEGAVKGAAIGAAAGLALGAAAMPLVGPLGMAAGAAVGAYTGALHGAVEKMGDKPPELQIPLRPAGVRLALQLSPHVTQEQVVATFHRHQVRSIEEAEGTWRDGKWADFDPVKTPRWVEEPTQHKP